MGYLASAVIVTLFKFCGIYLPKTKTFLILLSIYTEELSSAPKIKIFFPQLSSVIGNCELQSYPIPRLYLYLCESAFLVSFADSNKQLPSVKFSLIILTMYLIRMKYIN